MEHSHLRFWSEYSSVNDGKDEILCSDLENGSSDGILSYKHIEITKG